MAGQPIAWIEPAEVEGGEIVEDDDFDPDHIRPDLAEVIARHANTHATRTGRRRSPSGARPASAPRARTSRDLCDEGSFVRVRLAGDRRAAPAHARRPASQHAGRRRGHRARHVNADCVRRPGRTLRWSSPTTTRCWPARRASMNHKKKDRMFGSGREVAAAGGALRRGRRRASRRHRPSARREPGSTSDLRALRALSGLVPLVGVVNGPLLRRQRRTAGLLRRDHRHRATPRIGMGGPAMIEGGGLGVYRPRRSARSAAGAQRRGRHAGRRRGRGGAPSPASTCRTSRARSRLECADQRAAAPRDPENRLRVYDIRELIDTAGRRRLGAGAAPRLRRGHDHRADPHRGPADRPDRQQPAHLGGAIDATAADKAARFLQLCDAFDLPVLSLCDTPGFMVGPQAEKTALVRHVQPHVRDRRQPDGAGLHRGAAQGLRAGRAGDGRRRLSRRSSRSPGRPASSAAWGWKATVRLGFRKEMEAIADPEEREAYYESMVARLYENGKAMNDRRCWRSTRSSTRPQTRRWIMAGLRSAPPRLPREGRKRPNVDAW
jgi:hypothetical protein